MSKKLTLAAKVDFACFIAVVTIGTIAWIVGIVGFFRINRDAQIVVVSVGLIILALFGLLVSDARKEH